MDYAETRPILTYPPIEEGEIQEFRFDSYYTDCKLIDHQLFYVTKFAIEKGEPYDCYLLVQKTIRVQEKTYAIFAALNEDSVKVRDPNVICNRQWISRATCAKGEVLAVKTAESFRTGVQRSAGQCGLATLLAYLCMVDDDVSAGAGFDFTETEADPEFIGVKEMVPYFEEHCKTVIHFLNGPTPKIAGKAYLRAAMDADFHRVVTYYLPGHPHKGRITVLSTSDAVNLYTDEKSAADFSEQYGDYWYFCKLKN